jgi:hypothetical protein
MSEHSSVDGKNVPRHHCGSWLARTSTGPLVSSTSTRRPSGVDSSNLATTRLILIWNKRYRWMRTWRADSLSQCASGSDVVPPTVELPDGRSPDPAKSRPCAPYVRPPG